MRLVHRAQIIRKPAEGVFSKDIARLLRISRTTVQLWRQRFLALRLSGLEKDAPRPGRIPRISHRKVQAVIQATLHTTPPDATHWSARSMAQAQGLSKDTIHRIWKQHNLKPHLIETFKLSRDKRFIEKLHDVVGLYLNPPDKALVLCVDEKSQIQALDRPQPLLPLRPGIPARHTHARTARPQRQWHNDLVRCVEHARWHGHWRLHAAASPSRVYSLPAADRCQDTTRSGLTSDRRQLWNSQTTSRPILAKTPSPLPLAFHSHLQLLAEHGGALVPRDYRQAHPSRLFPERPGFDRRYQPLHPNPQSESQSFHLERIRRTNYGQNRQM